MTPRNASPVPTRGNWINLHTCDHCNLSCTYCYFRNKRQKEPTYDLQRVRDLVESAREAVTICFFGGEPTLNIPFMERAMALFDDRECTFAIQTNGTLLDRLPDEMLQRFVGIGVSIDGSELVTDAVRGKGTYARVIKNVEHVRPKVQVPIMARMTLTEQNRLPDDFVDLMEHFDAIYWQLDNDLGHRDFGDFAERYVTSLMPLIEAWEDQASSGRLINLIPIFGVYWLLTSPPRRHALYYHCEPGAGAVTVDAEGRIYSCPEGVWRGGPERGGQDIIGHLEQLGSSFPYEVHPPRDECRQCDIFHVCAGRCIWTRHEPYCTCTRALVDTVKASAGRLWRYMDRTKLRELYPTILTTEIIP